MLASRPSLFVRWTAYLAFGILMFVGATHVLAATPNPGHPWTEVGDGTFSVTGPSALRVFTFPDANATVLTSNAVVTPAQGGTGLSTFNQGDIPYASAANTLSALAKDTNATRYLSNTGASNAPAWSLINLVNGVSGVLPVANGGIGLSTITAGDVLVGNGTSAPTQVSPGTEGNVLSSNGSTWTSSAPDDPVMFAPIGLHAGSLTAVTALTSGTTYFEYIGSTSKIYTSCSLIQNVTTAAATITWAEVGIFKGVPVLNGSASLTRLGFTSVATTYNSTGRKVTAVSLSGQSIGDNLWVAFGSSATTPFQVRGMLADDMQSGVFQDASVRPSTAASPQTTTLESATAVPSWVTVKCN